jgi:hypothetical protein
MKMPEEKEYSASVEVKVRIRLEKVIATSSEEACKKAREEAEEKSHILFNRTIESDNVRWTEATEDPSGDVLVDVVGDEEFEHSVWYDEDNNVIQ